MNQIDDLFDRVDAWRHFPSYQLERRSCLFFSLYLPEVLVTKLDFSIAGKLAPEFPVRIGTIYPDTPIDSSFKIDYVALAADGSTAILVELKTEGLSRREEQDKYLLAARDLGLPVLLAGLLDIFRATKAKQKYFCLLEHLADMGLLRIPSELRAIMARPDTRGATAASRAIAIAAHTADTLIVYVQPNGVGPDIISFAEFAEVVGSHEDPVSQRFASSLRTWAAVRAGER